MLPSWLSSQDVRFEIPGAVFHCRLHLDHDRDFAASRLRFASEFPPMGIGLVGFEPLIPLQGDIHVWCPYPIDPIHRGRGKWECQVIY